MQIKAADIERVARALKWANRRRRAARWPLHPDVTPEQARPAGLKVRRVKAGR